MGSRSRSWRTRRGSWPAACRTSWCRSRSRRRGRRRSGRVGGASGGPFGSAEHDVVSMLFDTLPSHFDDRRYEIRCARAARVVLRFGGGDALTDDQATELAAALEGARRPRSPAPRLDHRHVADRRGLRLRPPRLARPEPTDRQPPLDPARQRRGTRTRAAGQVGLVPPAPRTARRTRRGALLAPPHPDRRHHTTGPTTPPSGSTP